MDPATIATAAVKALSPYLSKIADGALEKLGESSTEAGARLLGWLRTKLGKEGRDALRELENDPKNTDNEAELRVRLARELVTNPQLLRGLDALLAAEARSLSMIQDVSGTGAKAAQVFGSDNTIIIG